MLERTEEGGGPIGEIDIKRFENQIGGRLPGDYRSFLLEHNGGRPTPNGFIRSIDGRKESWGIHFFFSLNDSVEELRLNWNWDLTKDTRPKGVVPIAVDDFGNFLYLGFQPPIEGAVFFGATPSDGAGVKLESIAGSFGEFSNGLVELTYDSE